MQYGFLDMKTILIVSALMLSFFSASSFAGHTCGDGSYSGSDGRGTCSHHGGEAD